MLTELQKAKQRHYFDVLDFDRNGAIEEDDFVAIGENLCLLRDVEPGDDIYKSIMDDCRKWWIYLQEYVYTNHQEGANFEEWCKFVDEKIVNADEDWYRKHVAILVKNLLDLFDTNNDGVFSVNEYIDLFISYRIEVRFAPKAFKKLDANGDGTLSKVELFHAVDEFFRSDDPEASGNWLFGYWEKD